MTPVTVSDPVIDTGSGSLWICCCHSCHVYASNCLSEDSAQWGPSAKARFQIRLPPLGFCFLGWDGHAMSLKHVSSTGPLLTVSMRSLGDNRRWCKRRRKDGREKDYWMTGQVKMRYGGKGNERETGKFLLVLIFQHRGAKRDSCNCFLMSISLIVFFSHCQMFLDISFRLCQVNILTKSRLVSESETFFGFVTEALSY